jgi:hypothetical protein
MNIYNRADASTFIKYLFNNNKVDNMNIIKKQWNEMLNRGTMPLFEVELKDDQYLLVDLALTDEGVEFSFDSEDLPVSFDGDIETIHSNRYLLPFDEYVESLDSYLELISDNLSEGYLFPNDLMA